MFAEKAWKAFKAASETSSGGSQWNIDYLSLFSKLVRLMTMRSDLDQFVKRHQIHCVLSMINDLSKKSVVCVTCHTCYCMHHRSPSNAIIMRPSTRWCRRLTMLVISFPSQVCPLMAYLEQANTSKCTTEFTPKSVHVILRASLEPPIASTVWSRLKSKRLDARFFIPTQARNDIPQGLMTCRKSQENGKEAKRTGNLGGQRDQLEKPKEKNLYLAT